MGYDFQKIGQLICESGMSKKSFFSAIGMSERTFSKWASGTVIPREADLRKIAGQLQVSLSDLRINIEADATSADPPIHSQSIEVAHTPSKSNQAREPHIPEDAGFSAEEMLVINNCSNVIIFDTCSIMNFPEILEFINEEQLVVIPKVVLNELEHNKTEYRNNEPGKKAQKAISAIRKYHRQYSLVMADDCIDLIPDAYRAENRLLESNDNKILSVAIRYKIFTSLPVIFITDDYSLLMKASGEGIIVCTAEEFRRGEILLTPFGEKNPEQRFRQAEDNGEFNKAMLYAIILKKVNAIRKYLNEPIDGQIKDIAELYISLRTKKDVPLKERMKFVDFKSCASEYLDKSDMDALAFSFIAAYRDALSSLSGSIKQIAGDLE